MTNQILIVFGVLVGAIALFAWGQIRVDIVAILVMLALMLSHVLTPDEALAGFGNPAVILIAAIFIVGEGLVNTGVAHRLGEGVMKLGGGNETRLVVLIMLLAGGVGAFMSSSAIVAMLIPVVLTISKKAGLNSKRMLMPLSVAALISGMMTLIASSPNMIIEDALKSRGLAALGFFSFTPFGLAVLAAGIAFMLVARRMLSKQTVAEDAGAKSPSSYDLIGYYGLAEHWHRLRVPVNSPLINRAVAQRRDLYDQFGVILVGFEKHPRGKVEFSSALPETVFEVNDAIFVIADPNQLQQLIETEQLVKLPQLDERQRGEALQDVGAAEVMLAPESKLIGKTLGELEFRSRYHLAVLAVRHRGESLTKNLADQELDFGDTLLVAGSWAEIGLLRDDRENFLVLTLPAEYSERLPARKLAPVAVGIVVVMVAVMAFELAPNSAAALLAALAMIASGCVGVEIHLSRRELENSGVDRRHVALGDGPDEDRGNRANGEWNGYGFGIAGTTYDAGGTVFRHRFGWAVPFELGNRSVDCADCNRYGREPSRFAACICNDGSDRLLRRIRYAGIVTSEYVGDGTRRLCLWRLC